MAKEVGTNWIIKKDGTTIARGRNASLQLTQAFADATNKDSANWEESLPTIRSARIVHSGVLDIALSSYSDVEDMFFNQTSATILFDANSNKTYSATGYVESLQINASHDDVVTVDMTIRLTGAITRA